MFENDIINNLYNKISSFEQLSLESKKIKDKLYLKGSVLSFGISFFSAAFFFFLAPNYKPNILTFSIVPFFFIVTLACIGLAKILDEENKDVLPNLFKKHCKKDLLEKSNFDLIEEISKQTTQKEIIFYFESKNWDISNIKALFALKKYEESISHLSSLLNHIVNGKKLEMQQEEQKLLIADYEKKLHQKPKLKLVGE